MSSVARNMEVNQYSSAVKQHSSEATHKYNSQIILMVILIVLIIESYKSASDDISFQIGFYLWKTKLFDIF